MAKISRVAPRKGRGSYAGSEVHRHVEATDLMYLTDGVTPSVRYRYRYLFLYLYLYLYPSVA